MANHTPGPWKAYRQNHHQIPAHQIEDAAHMLVAYTGHTRTPGQADANATLIAAAPDLLSACKAALADIDSEPNSVHGFPSYAKLRDAIAAAEGGAS